VTAALSSLATEGKVEREGATWLLRGDPPVDYAKLIAG
jgi:hypothetical protein